MKTYKDYTFTKKIIDAEYCDKCKLEIDIEEYDAFDFKFEYRTGYFDGYGGWETETKSVDLCPECAEYLIELLQSEKIIINSKEEYN